MGKKRILWVTPDYFADCDIPYIPLLLKDFDIHWMVYLPYHGCRYHVNDFIAIAGKYDNLALEVVKSRYRERNFCKVFEYWKINKAIKRINPDIVYMNIIPASPWQIPMFLGLPKEKTIMTAHQGKVHEGMGHYKYYNFLRDIVYGRIKNINMFSKSQAALFKERYKNSHIFQWPLGLKDFGKPSVICNSTNIVRFLSFGIVNYAKHIDLLLEAANIVYEKGYHNFKVIVKGSCSNWTDYEKHIKYPNVVEADIRLIENSEIANLFVSSDYFVQPYRVISQSGPFKIALNYNVPLITSDLPGFKDEMIEGITGFLFETNNVEDLANVMVKAIELKDNLTLYNNIKSRMKDHVNNVYSIETMVTNYISMFNSVSERK